MSNKSIIFECSNCDKKLVEVVITEEDSSFHWTARAKCCYCQEEFSFQKEFCGHFSYKGYDVVDNLHPDGFKPLTNVIDVNYDKGLLTFITEKK